MHVIMMIWSIVASNDVVGWVVDCDAVNCNHYQMQIWGSYDHDDVAMR
jgi:hypothetical protein